MRAVLDVNVLIAALLSATGAAAQIVSRWVGGEFELVVSDQVLAELERALAYPKVRARVGPQDAAELVSLLRSTSVHASDPTTPPRRSVDPGDDYLLALAEAEEAMVVSGDQHLLELARRFPIRSARDFLELLEARR